MTLSRRSSWIASIPFAAALAATGCAPAASTSTDGTTRVEGHLRSYVLDAADGTSRRGYAIEGADGRYVEVEPSPTLDAHVGSRVTIDGRELIPEGRSVVQSGARRIVVDRVVASPRASTEQALVNGGKPTTAKVALVLLDFDGVTPQPYDQNQAKIDLATVHGYYKELSYGSWTVQTDVFGPFSVPKPADCSLDTIGALARQAAKAKGVAIDGYDHVGVTLPDNKPSGLDCACGLAWVGAAPAVPNPGIQGTSLFTCRGDNAFAHEMGHGFGLDHASKAHCNGQAMRRDPYSACMVEEYGNQFNVMGNGLGHFSAFQKSTMKWIDACNIVRVSKDDTFELVPIQVASDAVQSLQIATGDVKDGNPLYYYVEYRNPSKATFNAQDNGKVRELGPGVHIDVAPGYTASGGDHRVLLLDTSAAGDFGDPRLTPGRSFSDPDGRVTISVVDAGPDSAHVKVTFPKGGSGSNTCSNGAIPPTGGGTPSGVAALYQDCPFGGWTVSLMPGDYTAAQLATLGAKDNDASSVWLANGFEATLFDGPDLTGNSVKLTGSSQCLVSQNFNDVMSSIRIVAIGTGSAGAGGSGAAGSGTATGGKGGVGGASAGKGGASGSGTSAGGASAGAGGAPKGTGGVGGSAMKGGSGGTSTATTGGSGGHVTGGAAGHATAGAGGGTLQGAAGNDAANGDDSSSSGSGCSTSGTSGGGSAGWLMLGVAALIARGRRTRNRALSPSRREQGTGNRLQAMLGSGLANLSARRNGRIPSAPRRPAFPISSPRIRPSTRP